MDFLWQGRYFERQVALQARCGQHALNDLIGGMQFTVADLASAAEQVCSETDDAREAHVLPNGWYSHSVLATALQNTVPPPWRLLLSPLLVESLFQFISDPTMLGALVNKANKHWVAVLKHANLLWIVDSLQSRALLSAAALAELVAAHPNVSPVVENYSAH